MIQRFTVPATATALAAALVLGNFAPAQSKSNPKSAPVTATGIVVGAPTTKDFQLRTRAGIYQVRFHSKVNMKNIHGGDQVRVFGRPLGRVIYDANVRLLRARASDSADDYSGSTVESVGG